MNRALFRAQGILCHVRPAVPSAGPLLKTRSGFFSSTAGGAKPLLQVEIRDKIAVIHFDDPSHMNALTTTMGDQFTEAVTDLQGACSRQEVRACVLVGKGKAFSAGGDLQWLKERHFAAPFQNNLTMVNFYNKFLCIRNLPVPTIAAINGPAVGAGLAVALACDLRIASENAVMGVTFAKLGIHPGMGSSLLLPRVIGQQNATYLLLSGALIKGSKAKEMGLVLETVAKPEDTLSRALEIATELANNSPMSVRSCMVTLRNQKFDGLDSALEREADCQSTNYQGKDFLEGLDALKKRQPPQFQGW